LTLRFVNSAVFHDTLFAGKPARGLRHQAAAVLTAAIRAAAPGAAVKQYVSRRGDSLRVHGRSYDLRTIRHIFVVGAGKAAAPMATAIEGVLGARVTEGVIAVKYGYAAPLRRIRVVEAGHPLPDAAGQRAAMDILDLVRSAGPADLVLCVISGGGSALLPAPVDNLSLEDEIRVTDLLLRSGVAIQHVNAVRKHLSQIKGGRLASAASPARVVALILSDVLGNPVDAIASGPVSPDPTTYAEALDVIRRHGLDGVMPAAAMSYLQRGAAAGEPETPKPADPVFRRVQAVVVGSNEQAVAAAAERAKAFGFRTFILTTMLEGEAREAARVWCSVVRSVRLRGLPSAPPVCLLAGGETTVTVRGRGRGGRCQEFALAAGQAISGWPDTVVAALGTDGTDGPTDAAGALVDGQTVARAHAAGLDPVLALADNDSYPFFAHLGDLLMTGPTRTNVNDIYLALVGGRSRRQRR
jgi:hydroxypyruvate reductase